ncbi:MAG: 2-oxoglutarate and iron-dependent oxygenase domain-containing protein, partial [Nanoarchaeota archaeon]
MAYNPPIVDIRDYTDGGANRARFLDDFLRALDHPGFMLAVNTGFETGERHARFQEQRRLMKVFFQMSKKEKDELKVAGVNGEVGYTGFREERNRDLAEYLHFSPGVTPYAANVFPAIPGYQEVTLAIMNDLHIFSNMMFSVVAETFGKDPRYFENLCKGLLRNDVYRHAWYKGLRQDEIQEWKDSYRASEHDDSGFQTFIKVDKHIKKLEVD